jgi:hypothetical protein
MRHALAILAACALPLSAAAQPHAAPGAAPAAPSRAVQQGMEHGFRDCAPDLDQAVKLVHEDDDAYAHMGTWSTANGNGELFNSLTAAPGSGVTSFTGVKTAAGKCNTTITQVVPTDLSCEEAQKTGFKDWKAVGDLRGLPLLEDPTTPAVNVLMIATSKKTCLIIKHAVFFGR